MKKLYIILAIFGLFLSCDSEDEISPETDIKTAIFGEWKVESITNRDTYGCNVSGKETMTFSENGNLTARLLDSDGNPCKYDTETAKYTLNDKIITFRPNERETSYAEITKVTDVILILTQTHIDKDKIVDKDKAQVVTLTK